MAPRPGRIRRIVDIDLPHPRKRSLPELHRIRDEILFELVDGPPAAPVENLVRFPTSEHR